MHRPAVLSERATHSLSVQGEHELLCDEIARLKLGEEPRTHYPVELGGIDAVESTRDRPAVGGDIAVFRRVLERSEALEHLLGEVGRILAYRGDAACARERRAGRDR